MTSDQRRRATPLRRDSLKRCPSSRHQIESAPCITRKDPSRGVLASDRTRDVSDGGEASPGSWDRASITDRATASVPGAWHTSTGENDHDRTATLD